MKWFFRFFFWSILLVFFGVWGYISWVYPKSISVMVISPLQGNHILHAKEWGIYPERIIPGYVHIEPIPSQLKIVGNISSKLPYADLLNNIDNFEIQANYTWNYTLKPEDINSFTTHTQKDLIEYWKSKIDGLLLGEIQNHFQNNQFLSSTDLKNTILKQIPSMQGLEFNFTEYPNMEEYKKLKDQVVSVLSQEQLAAKSAAFNFEVLQEQKQLELKKQKISQTLDFSIEKSKSISEANADPQTTFSILSYLLGTHFESNTQIPNNSKTTLVETEKK